MSADSSTLKKTVVYDAKIRIIKQITTVGIVTPLTNKLLFMMQRYE